MTARSLERFLADEAATTRLGEDLALALRPGDVLALVGRSRRRQDRRWRAALIRALADDAGLEVPSPTFTLVQSYDAPLPVASFRPLPAGRRRTNSTNSASTRRWPTAPRWSNGRNAPATACRPTRAAHRARRIEGDGRLRRRSRAPATPSTASRRSLAIRAFLGRRRLGRSAPRRHFTGDASARAYET